MYIVGILQHIANDLFDNIYLPSEIVLVCWKFSNLPTNGPRRQIPPPQKKFAPEKAVDCRGLARRRELRGSAGAIGTAVEAGAGVGTHSSRRGRYSACRTQANELLRARGGFKQATAHLSIFDHPRRRFRPERAFAQD
jgi:hypothetical protein